MGDLKLLGNLRLINLSLSSPPPPLPPPALFFSKTTWYMLQSLSGTFGKMELAAHGILMQYSSFMYMVSKLF